MIIIDMPTSFNFEHFVVLNSPMEKNCILNTNTQSTHLIPAEHQHAIVTSQDHVVQCIFVEYTNNV